MAPTDTPPEPLSSDTLHPHRTEPRIFPWDLHSQPRIHGFATWEMDIINSVCRYSPEWTSITGYDDHTQEKPLNWTWWSGRMHADDMGPVRLLQAAIVEGKTREIELIFRFKRADGRWIRLLSRGNVVRWTDKGEPAHMSGMVLDISHLPDAALLATPLHEEGTPPQADILRIPLPCENPEQEESSRRAWLNERRLNALYHLSQMENASENELAHFTLSSIMQLTGSPSAFLFFSRRGSFRQRTRVLVAGSAHVHK